jgi:uncharacterized protein YwbE
MELNLINKKRREFLGASAQVTFIKQDARAGKLTDGTVFYMYTPFTGNMLRAVLDSLQGEGVRRDIRICTFGP